MMKLTKQTIQEFTMSLIELDKSLNQSERDFIINEKVRLTNEGKTDGIQYGGGYVGVRLWTDFQSANEWQNIVTSTVPSDKIIAINIEDINTDTSD